MELERSFMSAMSKITVRQGRHFETRGGEEGSNRGKMERRGKEKRGDRARERRLLKYVQIGSARRAPRGGFFSSWTYFTWDGRSMHPVDAFAQSTTSAI